MAWRGGPRLKPAVQVVHSASGGAAVAEHDALTLALGLTAVASGGR